MRRGGSYIYEEFMPTGGTDVKVQIAHEMFLCCYSFDLVGNHYSWLKF